MAAPFAATSRGQPQPAKGGDKSFCEHRPTRYLAGAAIALVPGAGVTEDACAAPLGIRIDSISRRYTKER
jgi:hypothetical protein